MKLPSLWLATYTNVKSAIECQEMFCQTNVKCTAFVYDIKTEACTLKNPDIQLLNGLTLEYEEGKVFGPKHCAGRIFYRFCYSVTLKYFGLGA